MQFDEIMEYWPGEFAFLSLLIAAGERNLLA
jgi:hypothetical protein